MTNPPLPPFIERSIRAQQLLPSHRPLLRFFQDALSRFQGSGAGLEVVGTLSGRDGHGPHKPLPVPARPPVRPRNLLVLDSSFNPPTRAHLRMAKSAVTAYAAAGPRVLLLLSTNNADKAAKPAVFEQRLAMMYGFAEDLQSELDADEDALGHDARAAVDIDIGLTTQPFFHDKSAAIASSAFYGGPGASQPAAPEPAPDQVFLVGYDTLVRVLNPKYYQPAGDPDRTPMQAALSPFFARARLRVTGRADGSPGGKEEQEAYMDRLARGTALEEVGGRREWASKVEFVEGRETAEAVVSSTLARAAAKQKDWEGVRRLVSNKVAAWIKQEELFADD